MIPYRLHLRENNNMIGNLTAIFYGILKASPPSRPSIRAHFVSFVCPRDYHHGFL